MGRIAAVLGACVFLMAGCSFQNVSVFGNVMVIQQPPTPTTKTSQPPESGEVKEKTELWLGDPDELSPDQTKEKESSFQLEIDQDEPCSQKLLI